jgi:hypothetical protein
MGLGRLICDQLCVQQGDIRYTATRRERTHCVDFRRSSARGNGRISRFAQGRQGFARKHKRNAKGTRASNLRVAQSREWALLHAHFEPSLLAFVLREGSKEGRLDPCRSLPSLRSRRSLTCFATTLNYLISVVSHFGNVPRGTLCRFSAGAPSTSAPSC